VIEIQGLDKDAGRQVGARIAEITAKGQEPKKQVTISVGVNHDFPEFFPPKEQQRVAEIIGLISKPQVSHSKI